MMPDIGRALGLAMVAYGLLLVVLWSALGHLNPRVQRAAAAGQALLMAAFVYTEFYLCR